MTATWSGNPKTWAYQEEPSFAEFNAELRDRMDYLKAEVDTLKANRVRVLDLDTTHAANVGTDMTALRNYVLPGGTLDTDGQVLRVRVWGKNANTANNWALRYLFGSMVVTLQSFGGSTDGDPWWFEILLTRVGGASQEAVAFGYHGNLELSDAVGTETLSGAVTCELQGQGGASNDVVQWGMCHELIPVPA